jgi:hypothetical protein
MVVFRAIEPPKPMHARGDVLAGHSAVCWRDVQG